MTNGLKSSLTNDVRTVIVGMLACITFLSIAACDKTDSSVQTETPPAPPPSVEAAKDIFDSIVTPEAVFPDPAVRALFELTPPETSEKGWRGYSFTLIQQPDMNNRHFCIISVVWAPAGTFHQGFRGTGGPGGGFVDFSTQTSDGKYDLRVSLGDLLPNTVNVPEFDLDSIAERLLLHYSQALNKQQNH
jgi:hypothetical protein